MITHPNKNPCVPPWLNPWFCTAGETTAGGCSVHRSWAGTSGVQWETLSQFHVKPLLISLKCLCLFVVFYGTARTTACLWNSFWKETSQIGGKWYCCSIPVAIPALLQLFYPSLLIFVPLDLINNCWVVIHLVKIFYSSSPLRNILAQWKE